MYAVLASIFFSTIIVTCLLIFGFVIKSKIWQANIGFICITAACWYIPYFIFILFFTGPKDLSEYPSADTSPYKLPWESGVSRILSQGNRSFTSHRGLHFYAWDFVMPTGTKVLAARDGVVAKVEQSFSTIGREGNYILIRHQDGQISGYFHLQQNGALVKSGDSVRQGQEIAFSGMTGQTILPHLHFLVFNSDLTASIPISFREVGVPLAGHFYTSENTIRNP